VPAAVPPSPERLELVKGLDSGLVAFDLETGREVWRSSDQLASYSTPVVTELGGKPRILAWTRDDFLVVDPTDGGVVGRFRWRADDVFSAVAASPVASGAEVLLSEAYEPGSVLLDLAGTAGELPRAGGRAGAAAIGVLRQDRRGSRADRALKAHWATPDRYEEVSRTRVAGEVAPGRVADLLTPPCWAAPVIARGLLYVRGKDRIVCLDLTDVQ
jgi:outer membrane protein assembly factor BamB